MTFNAPKIKRRHHVLPRFYLERFSREGRVLQTWQPGDRQNLISVNDASVRKDFYNISVQVNGRDFISDFWEERFSEVEGRAASAFREILDEARWPISKPAREALTGWIALQFLRGADVRRSHDNIQAAMARLQVGATGIRLLREKMESHLGRPVEDAELEAEWDDVTGPDGPTIKLDPKMHLATLERSIPRVFSLLGNRRFGLVRFKRRSLVTGDTPVTPLPGSDFASRGIENCEEIAVPLSRRVGLALFREPGPDWIMEPSTNLAWAFNGATIGNSREWVISHPDDAVAAYSGWHPPFTSEATSSSLDHFIDRDAGGHLRQPSPPDLTGQRLHLRDYEWPIDGRVFQNPYSPQARQDRGRDQAE